MSQNKSLLAQASRSRHSSPEPDSSESSHNTDGEHRELEGGSTPPRRKKPKRLVRYRHDWEKRFSWVEKVQSNVFKAYCNLCRLQFSISHGGKSDVVHHSKTEGHVKADTAANSKAIDSYFVRSTPRSTVDQQVGLRITVTLIKLTGHISM